MHPKLSTCVAYVAGRLISDREAPSIYDNSQARTITIEGTVTPAHGTPGSFRGSMEGDRIGI
jgi:hypothetical protein